MFWFHRHQCYSHNATSSSSSSLASFRLVNRPRRSRMSYVSDRTAKAHPVLCENLLSVTSQAQQLPSTRLFLILFPILILVLVFFLVAPNSVNMKDTWFKFSLI
ncbi:hypothetical protein ACLKA7_008184 [Drosophila subpalustris]